MVSVTTPSHGAERREEARHIVRRVVAFLKQEGLAVEGEVLHGRPDQVIVQTALGRNADLIVMGSHGRTGLERTLLGSISERVINETKCAVLAVKAS